MKKILLSILPLLAFAFVAKAQMTYTITADTAYFNLPADNTPHKAKFTITNNSSSVDTFEWRLVTVDKPSDWIAPGVCDWRNCYLFNDFTWHKADMAANKSEELYVEMRRPVGGTQGCSKVYVEYRQQGQTAQGVNLVHTDGSDLNCWPNSTKDISKAVLVDVYPNPVRNEVNLNILNKNIKSVVLSNIIGKQIQRMNISNSNGAVHQLSLQSLPKGIYILQFKNDSGKVLGVSRITKQ